jgi:hypothetical protein
MSNIPSREALNMSTPQLQSDQPLPRDYRVTGTQPTVVPLTTAPKKASASANSATLFWIFLIATSGLVVADVWFAHKANWI